MSPAVERRSGGRCPVASRVALDLPHWVMRSAPYRLIRMAIEMAPKADAIAVVVGFELIVGKEGEKKGKEKSGIQSM